MTSKKTLIPAILMVGSGMAIQSASTHDVNFSTCTGSFQDNVQLLSLNCQTNSGNPIAYQRIFTRPLGKECSSQSSSIIPVPTPSNSTVSPVDNSTSDSNSTMGVNSTDSSNTTTPVDNTTTSVDNSTVVDNSPLGGGGRRLQSDDGTDVSVMNSTSVDNSTTVANETEDGNSTIVTPPTASPPMDGGMVQCCDFFEKGAGYEFTVCDGQGAFIRTDLVGSAKDQEWANMPQDVIDLTPAWTELTVLVDNYCTQKSDLMN